MENDFQEIKDCLICGKVRIQPFCFKNGHLIYKCAACGLLFVNPIPELVSNIYSDDYFSGAEKGFGYVNYDRDKEPMRPTFLKYLKLIETYRSGRGKLLDVGAATGFFTDLANKSGWEAMGIEISEWAASYGREKGLNIMTGSLSASDLEAGFFDVITMWDVLEHFADPLAEIKKASQILKPGGVLAINTPDAASLMAKILKSRWHLLVPPEHLFYFNMENIDKLLSGNGFDIYLKTRLGKKFTLAYVMHILANWQRIRILDRAAVLAKKSFLNKLQFPINLRDNMFIIAIKRP